MLVNFLVAPIDLGEESAGPVSLGQQHVFPRRRAMIVR
jgi:hypothetical protein